MHREHIRATSCWRNNAPRFDCVFIKHEVAHESSFHPPFDIARVFMFFSFIFEGKRYECALVHWFEWTSEQPDEDTGMWIVSHSIGKDALSIVPVQRIIRAAHLIPLFGRDKVDAHISNVNSLDEYHFFYVNKYADHHAFEMLHS
ncbi:hypothetical protein NEOLEDRAFT_1060095 [Neolentinus lepideus HHB14362 ss-1]|uniref:Uncharacterized protein n=1 Tax=Neolentinus lepideus HHB14362 ss-1 TaxID=1314782 RepID=A0A165U7P5_9AGAM|nr:hypothetical protein NEOLEDRAFT_1060095 [Neolentinus lepideus HHB14362 ss-1]